MGVNEDKIFLIGSTYNCPLRDRLDNCAIRGLLFDDLKLSYQAIQNLNPKRLHQTAEKCRNCQSKTRQDFADVKLNTDYLDQKAKIFILS